MTYKSSRSATLLLIVACLAVLAAPHASLARERQPQVPATLNAKATPQRAAAVTASSADTATRHRRIEIDGIELFYREAGPPDAPVVILLHGFPTSSNMFRNLIPALADRYHLIAPDYPGFGQSVMPSRENFNYSFAKFAELIDGLLNKLGQRYALYVMDYGAPVGYRLALKHPERVTALVVQNGCRRPAGVLGPDQGLLGQRVAAASRGAACGDHA